MGGTIETSDHTFYGVSREDALKLKPGSQVAFTPFENDRAKDISEK
ncbi:MAG: hypothetical protein WC906_02880 [Parcubacteria group bacterium]|jgi:hypothetical protein